MNRIHKHKMSKKKKHKITKKIELAKKKFKNEQHVLK